MDHRNYRLYLTKFEESRISNAMDTEKIANVSLIEPARPPLEPVSPKVMLNMVLALMLYKSYAIIMDSTPHIFHK